MNRNLFLGVVLSLTGAFLYSLQTALVKMYADHLPLSMIVFAQSAVSLLLILPVILKNGLNHAKKTFVTKQVHIQLLRTVCSLSTSYLLFYSVQYIPLVNAMLLANTSPLIVPFIGYLFLSQEINHRLWIPIITGLVGVALVLHPDARIFHPSSLLALGAAVSMAVSMLAVRKLSSTDSSETTTFYFLFFSSCISGAIALHDWEFLSIRLWSIIIGIGVLYFLVQYSMTYALRYSSAQLISPLFYSVVVFSALISFIAWHTLPDISTLTGICLTIIGGICCIRAEVYSQQRKIELQQA